MYYQQLLWIILSSSIASMVLSYPIAKCNETIQGTTTAFNTTHLYSFHCDNHTKRILINTCGSTFDTDLYLYNGTDVEIAYNDFDYSCGGWQSVLRYQPMTEGNYSIAITGYNTSDYGDYLLQILCYPTIRIYNRSQCMTTIYMMLINILSKHIPILYYIY